MRKHVRDPVLRQDDPLQAVLTPLAPKAVGANPLPKYRHENRQLRKVPWIPRGPQHRRGQVEVAVVAVGTVGHLVVRRLVGHLVVRKAPQRSFSQH